MTFTAWTSAKSAAAGILPKRVKCFVTSHNPKGTHGKRFIRLLALLIRPRDSIRPILLNLCIFPMFGSGCSWYVKNQAVSVIKTNRHVAARNIRKTYGTGMHNNKPELCTINRSTLLSYQQMMYLW